jgi:hypothetical protein
MSYTTRDLFDDVSQALIALVVLVGGGWAVLSGNSHTAEVVPLMSVVVGFYFGTRTASSRQQYNSSNGNGSSNPAAKG